MQETRAEAPREVTDEQLLTEASHGDFKAFESLVRRYEKSLVNYLFRLGAPPAVAEELSVQTLRRLFEQLDQLPLSDRPDLWVLRTARKIFAAHDSFHAESAAAEATPAPSLDDPDAPAEGSRSDTRLRRRFEPWIRAVLSSIPRPRREALVLKVYHGLSYRDIARVTGAPPGTIYHWIHISLAEIAKQV